LFFSILLICGAALFGMIVLHECGHFFAGIAAGIPADQMKICLLTFPQHVALRDGEGWVTPRDYARYVSRSLVFIKNRRGAFGYVAGGLVVESTAFAALVLGSRSLEIDAAWLLPVTRTLASMPLVYLVADLLFTYRAKHPCGDFSALWRISPVASAPVIGAVMAIHAAGLVYVLGNASS
jgi:hypothetical protein